MGLRPASVRSSNATARASMMAGSATGISSLALRVMVVKSSYRTFKVTVRAKSWCRVSQSAQCPASSATSRSGTRREEILMDPDEYRRVTVMRRVLADMDSPSAMELLVTRIAKTKTNAEFLMSMSIK